MGTTEMSQKFLTFCVSKINVRRVHIERRGEEKGGKGGERAL